ncbi:hypothetical protein [Spiroplasma apis]|nr:hypothetical protein [Spiroplasma apis]
MYYLGIIQMWKRFMVDAYNERRHNNTGVKIKKTPTIVGVIL